MQASDDDFDQTLVPDAFAAIFVVRGRLTVDWAELQVRHELAETLASQVAAICPALPLDDVGEQTRALGKVRVGLANEPPPVDADEARWVVGRVAELLGHADVAVAAGCMRRPPAP